MARGERSIGEGDLLDVGGKARGRVEKNGEGFGSALIGIRMSGDHPLQSSI